MIFREGFYHADPHPGNFLVLAKGRLGVLDAGMVGRLDDTLRGQVVEMLLAVNEGDSDRLVDVLTEMCMAPANLDRSALSAELTEALNEFGSQAVGNIDIGGALTAVTRLMHEYNVFMPSRLSMLIRCLIELEGTARGMSAKFNLVELLEPYQRQFMLEQLSPAKWLRKEKRWRRDWIVLAESIPRSIGGLLDQLQSGDLTIRIRHFRRETAVNRLAYALCISALLIASAMLWIHRVPPTVHGISIIGAAGYLLAAFLATRVLWSIRLEKHAEG